MLIEEMPFKIYKWQKRKKQQQTKQLYKRRRRGGAHMVFSTGGGRGFEVTPLTEYPMNTTVRDIWK